MKTLYFAYGSNMNSKQMRERCPDSKKIGIGYMDHTTICFPNFYEGWEGGVAGYKRAQGKKLWGVIYELSQADVSKLRVFEDYEPGRESHLNSYIEVMVDVESDNEILQCMTYEVRVTGNYRPSLRYLQTIIHGATENDLPEDYLEELSQLL